MGVLSPITLGAVSSKCVFLVWLQSILTIVIRVPSKGESRGWVGETGHAFICFLSVPAPLALCPPVISRNLTQ
jgi:hypothetical protein